jgi:DNA polymerase I
METQKNNLLLIDGHSLAYRAYYAFPNTMTLPDGSPSNALYGFITLLFGQIERTKPKYLGVCFDRKEKTFRHEMYPAYKAHRPPSPQDFRDQIDALKILLNKIDVPVLELPGYEADDIIGTIGRRAEKEQIYSLVLTADKDFYQLISDYVHIIVPQRGARESQIFKIKNIEAKYGLTPNQIIDLKALQGDPSDNIPGVAGVGEKTALTLLHEYPSLNDVYDNVDQLKSEKLKEKLINSKEQAYLSYKLAEINCEVPIDRGIAELLFEPNWENILDSFKELQFNNLYKKYLVKSEAHALSVKETVNKQIEKTEYKLIDTLSAVKALIPKLKKGFACDLETTSLNARDAQIVGISISFSRACAVYIPFNKYIKNIVPEENIMLFSGLEQKEAVDDFQINPYLKLLQPLLEDPKIPKYTHNGKYEYVVLKNHGIELSGIEFDSMLAAYLLYPGDRIGLKQLVYKIYQCEMTTFEEVVGKGKSKLNFSQIDINVAKDYACADADFTFRLKEDLVKKIQTQALDNVFYNIEMPLQTILGKMEFTGVAIDSDYLHLLDREFTSQLKIVEKTIFNIAGTVFNINSPKQLGDILYDSLDLPVLKKTKTGRSTDSSVLEKLQSKHEIAKYLLDYRSLSKLLNTYVRALPFLVNIRTNKIHASFNQTITATGRLSSSNPNLQNIPIRTKDGEKIRGAFICSNSDGYILSADYSQIELRVMAHLAQDKNMIQAFQNNEDIHKSTAAIINNISLDEVSKEQRSNAKAVNFGIIYGISPFGLSQNLNIPAKEAKEIIENYFEKFPNIKKFFEDTILFAEKNSFVRTEFGRFRPITGINDPNHNMRQFAKRAAVNTRVQGTAADIMKLAMISIQSQIETLGLTSKMAIQVHDELVFDVPIQEKDQMVAIVRKEMESAVQLSVPLTVDISAGKNWLQAH